MILRPSDIPGGKHAGDKNIESNHQRSDEAYIWRLTSLLVAEIETQACCFQCTHVNDTHFSAMQADTSKRVTWL